jgi:hypothetical protein
VGNASNITALMMEALRTSETSVYPNETTRRYMPEGSNLHTRRRENLKSDNFAVYFLPLPTAMKTVVRSQRSSGFHYEHQSV